MAIVEVKTTLKTSEKKFNKNFNWNDTDYRYWIYADKMC